LQWPFIFMIIFICFISVDLMTMCLLTLWIMVHQVFWALVRKG